MTFVKIIMGLALLLGGLILFSSGLKTVAQAQWLEKLVTPFSMLIYCMGFTAIFQSSSLTVLILLGLASGGTIPLEVGIAGIFGSNIGTCITAILGSLPLDIEAKRIAFSHIFFNVGGVLLFYPFLPYITQLVRLTIK